MGKTTALSDTRTYEGYFGYAVSNNSISLCKGMIKKIDEQLINKELVLLEGVFNMDGGVIVGTNPYAYGSSFWTYPQKPSLVININGGAVVAGNTVSFNGRTYTAVSGGR